MAKWITTWPGNTKWGRCSAAMAAQIAAEGRCAIRLVPDEHRITRYIMITPPFAQTLAQRHPAVALARRLSPLDLHRARQAA